MIWIPETALESASLAAYIKDYLLRMGVSASDIDPHCVDQLSHALSDYIELSSDRAGFFVEDGNLLLLASRALQSVGEDRAATRMLMLGSGFAQPVKWLATTEDAAWKLDVSRISDGAQAGLEILFFRCLHAAVEALAEEWKSYSGEIALVLQGVEEAGTALIGRPANTRQVRAFVEEVEMVTHAKLKQLSARYEWTHTPRLLKAKSAISKGRRE